MNRTQKRAILAQLLQGNLARLQALKQERDEQPIMFSVDMPPKGWIGNPNDERAVKVYYQLGDKEVVEYLTYAQMREKTKGVICILPHNQRSGHLVKMFATIPPLIEE
ncbi:hypothetical protein GCM10028808_10500 [Spirosoma migulaei]